ncbi:glutamate-1-semialdehyde 2,1-aminomutase [Plantactinospora mayteni]|uniref:Glutamate-1-semialdehyde 2,1-aminomutase n=1 Tax=Plantactinospora mayteni TaxID=566021 RepID=A0ABQ4ERE1_9ACTN|nr:glutamate-1-semialdehyde 2,1-aminomutase [Plantactinospora mayteni]GIG97242.1 glutamate-1-semialdehyde 2,1-aminomutase [Plantactinospora mayteni]
MARKLTTSAALFESAKQVIAGGVSSDARRSPGVPLYVDHASGSRLWDVDGNSYLDYVLGQGPAVLGHCAPEVVAAVVDQVGRGISYAAQHRLEVEVAERLCRMVPSAELVRFNSVGSEAVHGALRLARAFTGRAKVLKFEGHYHGWFDPVLYSLHPDLEQAGPVEEPVPVPGSPGQPSSAEGDVVVVTWNDVEAVRAALEKHRGEIAAVIMEPILCNTGAIVPLPGYLEGVRDLCDEHGALLIFDEIITGFRVAPGGAQERLGALPDLATFGKAMAGGMQVSALAGRASVMETIASGRVAHAGTFNSHPVAMAAANATLTVLDEERDDRYGLLYRQGERLMEGLREAARQAGVQMLVDGLGPVFQTYFTSQESVRDYRDFARTDRQTAARFHAGLQDRGINIVPRGLWLMSTAHTDADIEATIQAATETLHAM